MSHSFQHIGVVGAGAWGTALAASLCRAERRVVLWAHASQVATIINQQHENTVYLKGVALDHDLKATGNLADLADCDAWILATPAQHSREIAKRLVAEAGARSDKARPLIIAAKGIEQTSGSFLSDVMREELPDHPIAILSGPSFAHEVARGLPTALTLAIKDRDIGEALMHAIGLPTLRLYLTDDVIGAQLGGAIKNVLAVGCGIVTGRQLGENARAALITRGLAEMLRLGTALGVRPETLMGLSGLGDLALTCASTQSRNMSLGLALGQGKSLHDILAHRNTVTEGVTTAAAAQKLARRHKVEMPIVAAVDAVLNGRAPIDEAIANLLARPRKVEHA